MGNNAANYAMEGEAPIQEGFGQNNDSSPSANAEKETPVYPFFQMQMNTYVEGKSENNMVNRRLSEDYE